MTTVRRTPWPAGTERALGTPLQPSVVYGAESPDALDALYEGRAEGFTYAREGHPNAAVLGAKINAMEGCTDGIVTGSGMAAVTLALLALAKSGDHVLGGNQLYGRSLRLFSDELPRLGIAASTVDATDAGAVAAALRPETRAILIEVVSNPGLRIADLDAIAELAKARGIALIVDNTFTTPRAIHPFEHGADVVLHSVTKLMAGHSDVTLGWAAARDTVLAERMRVLAVTMGLTPSPFDCWLAERGLYTFDLRYDRAEENARALADMLAETQGVRRVLYPGRPDHPDAGRARQLLGARTGNMVTFDVDDSRAAANALVRAAEGLAFAPTLGDVATTLSHPATSSHRALSPEARRALGIGEGTFRVSVGVEPFEIIGETFARAVSAARGAG
ncbi:aminotransferase class I/II-fold pyridoxal phosphate-dependent enzyme [Palleronia sediminis]|uniref:Aminotransferase class I/II-fold pyridoxal phosphate-dependent enzyme n=1 Tax=Palleronia sediminis TaxID=2547833 RepID=A0A4R6AM67_9RHOB|nr:aminotransferase class I/II-fold pyridoxal phosphate-dependent enzyme [Palleronia sediminis]TDL83628.1 aminotransferase class I/II-fold pyridoxal phosphate-dependent enzyme [Palleronia sediminis]